MYIESDVYDDNNNFIYRRIITQSGQSFHLTGLSELTNYTVRSRRNEGGVFSAYSYESFTTNTSKVPYLVYTKSLDFGTMWRGDLYIRNLYTGNEMLLEQNVSFLYFWTIPRFSKDGRYLAYHTYGNSGNGHGHGNQWCFTVRDMETNTIYRHITHSQTAEGLLKWNWKANSSSLILTPWYNGKTSLYDISTGTLSNPPTIDFAGNGMNIWMNNDVIFSQDISYSPYNRQMNKRNYDNTGFSWIASLGNYQHGNLATNNEETFIYRNSYAIDNSRYRKFSKISTTASHPETVLIASDSNVDNIFIHTQHLSSNRNNSLYLSRTNEGVKEIIKFNTETEVIEVVGLPVPDLSTMGDVVELNYDWLP